MLSFTMCNRKVELKQVYEQVLSSPRDVLLDERRYYLAIRYQLKMYPSQVMSTHCY